MLYDAQPQNTPENTGWEKLYKLSAWHGVANMAFYGINRLKADQRPPEEVMMKFQNEYMKAMAKEATQHIAVEQILKPLKK